MLILACPLSEEFGEMALVLGGDVRGRVHKEYDVTYVPARAGAWRDGAGEWRQCKMEKAQRERS